MNARDWRTPAYWDERRELLDTLRHFRERAALDGNWGAFEQFDARIRRLTERKDYGETE